MDNQHVIDQLQKRISHNFDYFMSIIQSDTFFKGKNTANKHAQIIDDKDLAWELYSNESIGDPYYNWVEIKYSYNFLGGFKKEELKEKIIDLGDQLTDKESLRLINIFESKYYEKFYNTITEVLEEMNLSDFIDFVTNDFYNFLLFYTYLDQKIPFIENEISIYKDGGFPCGWKGNFPNGNFVVFSCCFVP